MRLFPLRAGLYIGTQHLSLVVLERHREVCRLREAQVVDLPSGLIQPSPAALNITDAAEFRSILKKMLQPLKGVRNLSLGLPDPSVRAALISVDHHPVKGSELDDLIRWQMEKIFLSPLSNARIIHRPIPSARKVILGISIQQEILQQYEDPIRSLGIQPAWISISSFQLFNLYHDLLLQLAGAPGRFLVLNPFDCSFTLMVFKEGILDFLRIKGLTPSPSRTSAMPEAGLGFEGWDDESLSEMFFHELNTSINFYGQSEDPTLLSHLFVFGRKMSEFLKKAHDLYHIEVEPLEPERLNFIEGLSKVRPEQVPLVTPAIAAAVETVGKLSRTPKIVLSPQASTKVRSTTHPNQGSASCD
jgi:hypothetical protein